MNVAQSTGGLYLFSDEVYRMSNRPFLSLKKRGQLAGALILSSSLRRFYTPRLKTTSGGVFQWALLKPQPRRIGFSPKRVSTVSSPHSTPIEPKRETADRRRITSFHWAEPLKPDHIGILTPPVPTVYLSAGDYLLFVTGRDPNGSFVRVAEYSFRFVRDSGRSLTRSHRDSGEILEK